MVFVLLTEINVQRLRRDSRAAKKRAIMKASRPYGFAEMSENERDHKSEGGDDQSEPG
jgi:hypothetical protein